MSPPPDPKLLHEDHPKSVDLQVSTDSTTPSISEAICRTKDIPMELRLNKIISGSNFLQSSFFTDVMWMVTINNHAQDHVKILSWVSLTAGSFSRHFSPTDDLAPVQSICKHSLRIQHSIGGWTWRPSNINNPCLQATPLSSHPE